MCTKSSSSLASSGVQSVGSVGGVGVSWVHLENTEEKTLISHLELLLNHLKYLSYWPVPVE